MKIFHVSEGSLGQCVKVLLNLELVISPKDRCSKWLTFVIMTRGWACRGISSASS